MVLTMVADCRNSPCSGRPSTSSRTVWIRSPCATAATARVTSRVGQSRSSISVLTEPSISPQAPLRQAELDAVLRLALAADALADALELLRHALVGGDDFVERVGDLAFDADPVAGHANRKVADPHRLQRGQKLVGMEGAVTVDGGLGRYRTTCDPRCLWPDFFGARHGGLPSAPWARNALFSKRMYGVEVAEWRRQSRGDCATTAQPRIPTGHPPLETPRVVRSG